MHKNGGRVKNIKDFTYDALSEGPERNRYVSFDTDILELRNQVLNSTRAKVFQDMDMDNAANRRTSEKAFFYYISTGDIVRVGELIRGDATQDQQVGDISENALFQEMSMFISAITLFTRAALDGGLPETIAYNLSDAYIHAVLELKDPSKITKFIFAAFYDFTYEVHCYKYRDCSPVVKKCCEYINRHLHDEISLDTLSELTGRSNNYISDSFFRDLQVRPTVYIRKLKLDYARHVLETADLSVAAISDLLAFPSTSSFIAYFKEEYGLTPLQFKRDKKPPA